MAPGHPEPGDPPLLGRLTSQQPPADGARYYGEAAARWYGVENGYRGDDVAFYLDGAEMWAGPGGAVLELGCGDGRVGLPLARAGFSVTGVDASTAMLDRYRRRLEREPEEVRRRVTLVEADMRKLRLDGRLWRYACLPFNTLLMLNQPHERQQALERVREHLAPSGAFALEIFTPDPRRLRDSAEPEVELDLMAQDEEAGEVRVTRTLVRRLDLARQLIDADWHHEVRQGDRLLAEWDDHLEIAWMYWGELALLLERQGFRVAGRYGGPDRRPYAPTPDDVQPMFVEARIAP